MDIKVFTQSAIKLSGSITVYFDPFQIEEKYHDADYIFITHDHYDHYDESSIGNAIKDTTLLIVPKILEEKVKVLTKNILAVEPNDKYKIKELEFETLPSYNLNKEFHPQEKEYVGYNIKVDGINYYVMGDTDVVPEITSVKTDVCFIPIGDKFTMNYTEAADYINLIKPKKVIPTHYGSIIGSIDLGIKFSELIDQNIKVDLYLK